MMRCSVYIATSVDGFIATKNGSVDWLHSAGNSDVDLGENADMGFHAFLSSVDCIIMGRKCMEAISNMNLTPEQWPYGEIRIIVLSNTLKNPLANLEDKVEMYSGDLITLVKRLESEGHNHAYIDGGRTIQEFIKLKLIQTMTITKAPILLGEGISLFGGQKHQLRLVQASAVSFPNDFVQLKYTIDYPDETKR